MTDKRSFAPVPDFMAEMAAKTPGGQAPAPAPVAPTTHAESSPTTTVVGARLFREREAFQKMSINMPKALYEELRAYMKIADVPMSEVIVEATRRELIRLRKLGAEQ